MPQYTDAERLDLIVHLLRRVDTSGTCWEFGGTLDKDGYGRFERRDNIYRAHRLSYQLFVGEIPEDRPQIRHTCDNRRCVRPDHLLTGTHMDNVDDRVKRGRGVTRKGEDHPQAKITKAIRDQIVARYAVGGVSMKALAKEYGLSRGHTARIIRGERWLPELK